MSDIIRKYPSMDGILRLKPNPHILLGKEIFWTAKEDGSNIGAYLDENKELQLRSRTQEKAADDFYDYFNATDEAPKVRELLENSRTLWGHEWIVFGELLVKGRSPARSTVHEQHRFVVFDMWSITDQQWLNYNGVYQRCYQYDLPVVELWGTCKCSKLDTLLSFRDQMLEKAKEEGKEGVVGKTWFNNDCIYFKEKLDLPKIEKLPRVEEEGKPELPELPDSEVWGAIEKVRTDIGNKAFLDVRAAMPKVAAYVKCECEKHNCASPSRKLFSYYTERCAEVVVE